MNPISAIIVIKNNPPHILETIASIKDFVKEIIIGNIGMDLELKNELEKIPSLRCINISKSVPYVELIREELKKEAREEYVLFLDPDELLPNDLKMELVQHLKNHDYFSIPRQNIIFGKRIQHSRWWPDYQVRLFKKDSVIWPQKIHKQPTITGKGYVIPEKKELAITHYNYESIDEYMEKALRYAKAESKEKLNDTEYSLLIAVKNGLSEFISRFFAFEGYKDGVHGFVLAFLQMFYSFLVYFYWWEGKKYPPTQNKQLNETVSSFFTNGLFETQFWMNEKNIKKTGLRGKLLAKLLKH